MVKYMEVFESFIVMFILIFIGLVLNKKKDISDNTISFISDIIIDISVPALIFVSIIRDYDSKMFRQYYILPIFGIVISVVGLVISWLIGRKILKLDNNIEDFIFVSIFGNNLYLGGPLCLILFGSQGLIMAILLDFGVSVFLWSIGILLINENQKTFNSNFILKLINPPILGMLMGLLVILFKVNVPSFVLNVSDLLGGLTIPLAMIFIGIQIPINEIKDNIINKKICFVSIIKLLLIPISIYFLTGFFDIPNILRHVIILESAMPVFASSTVIMLKYNRDVKFVASSVCITTILSLITIPLIILNLNLL